MKITILIDIKDSFFLAYIRILENKLKKISNEVYFIKNKNELKKGNILFCISCKSILKKEELKKNKFNIIAHPSKLPIDKGSAAVAHAILKNKKKIYITLFEASNKIDSGDIYSQSNFVLKGSELCDEIRKKQALLTIKMICDLAKKIKFKKIKGMKQKKNNKKLLPKRNTDDSELNINKSIKSQFNLLRIVDNERYPAFFKYKNNKFVIKIFKKK